MPSDAECLSTRRLTLIPFSADLLRLALTNREALESRLAARFLPQWRTENQLRVLNGVLHALEIDPESGVWRFYFILHTADRSVIGDAGFKGPPDHGGSGAVADGEVCAPAGAGADNPGEIATAPTPQVRMRPESTREVREARVSARE